MLPKSKKHYDAIKRYYVYRGFVDAMPNKSWALALALKYPDNIGIQFFKENFKETEEAVPGDSEPVEVLHVNRDDSLNDLVDDLKSDFLYCPINLDSWARSYCWLKSWIHILKPCPRTYRK